MLSAKNVTQSAFALKKTYNMHKRGRKNLAPPLFIVLLFYYSTISSFPCFVPVIRFKMQISNCTVSPKKRKMIVSLHSHAVLLHNFGENKVGIF